LLKVIDRVAEFAHGRVPDGLHVVIGALIATAIVAVAEILARLRGSSAQLRQTVTAFGHPAGLRYRAASSEVSIHEGVSHGIGRDHFSHVNGAFTSCTVAR